MVVSGHHIFEELQKGGKQSTSRSGRTHASWSLRSFDLHWVPLSFHRLANRKTPRLWSGQLSCEMQRLGEQQGNGERGREACWSAAGAAWSAVRGCRRGDASCGLICEAAKYCQPFIAHDSQHAMWKLSTHTFVVASQRGMFVITGSARGPARKASQPYDSLKLCDVKTCS